MVCPICGGSARLVSHELASARQAYEIRGEGERQDIVTYRHQCDKCRIYMDVPLLVRIGSIDEEDEDW
jgi:hypothetical protein